MREMLSELVSILERDGTVLLVGEGNFSFSLALANACNHGHIISTGYDSKGTVMKKYPNASMNITLLDSLVNVEVAHGIDVRNLTDYHNRNILVTAWLFPHVSGGSVFDIEANRSILRAFFKSCIKVSKSVFVALRNSEFYKSFRLVSQARAEGMVLDRRLRFAHISGYTPVRTVPSQDPCQSAPSISNSQVYCFHSQGSQMKKRTLASTVMTVKKDLEPCEVCGTGVFTNIRRRNAHFNSHKHALRRKRQRL